MASTAKKLHTLLPPQEKISILLVSPHQQDHAALRSILHHGNWDISRASDLREATLTIQSTRPSVVLCERDLPDGTWKELLDCVAEMDHPPLLLVASRQADEGLWAEVLNLGGYDVLEKPFDLGEVTRVIGMAWRHWYGARRPSASAGPPVLAANYA